MSRPAINADRLLERLFELGRIGALPGGGVCRLALSDADRSARDLLVEWMHSLDLSVSIDAIGNIWGIRAGRGDEAPVMIGSHIDSVATGGIYDGALGVVAGLEIVRTLNESGAVTKRPLAVAAFSNEEGARFSPDMMGSGVHQGALDLDDMLASVGIDGTVFGDELRRIGYAGELPPRSLIPAAFLELHVEQGPILEQEGFEIGAVTGVQGISWNEFVIQGESNHAGTTPMTMRRDAGAVAAQIAVAAREIANQVGPPQVATVGALELTPGLVNVIPARARVTVDLRNTDETTLEAAESQVLAAAENAADAHGCSLSVRSLARFSPVRFDPDLVGRVEIVAKSHGLAVRRMPSGAGHDAQMFAPSCPTAMIFVPSKSGLSHNIDEYTEPRHLVGGAQVLFDVTLDLIGRA